MTSPPITTDLADRASVAGHALCDALDAGSALPQDVAARLALHVAAITDALGYRPRRGHRRPETTSRKERRDQLIREIAERHFANRVSLRSRARALRVAWTRYRANVFRVQPDRQEPAGSEKADLQALCRLCPAPLSESAIAKILSASGAQ